MTPIEVLLLTLISLIACSLICSGIGLLLVKWYKSLLNSTTITFSEFPIDIGDVVTINGVDCIVRRIEDNGCTLIVDAELLKAAFAAMEGR